MPEFNCTWHLKNSSSLTAAQQLSQRLTTARVLWLILYPAEAENKLNLFRVFFLCMQLMQLLHGCYARRTERCLHRAPSHRSSITKTTQGWKQEIPCENPQGWCRRKQGGSLGSLPPGPTCHNTQASQKAPSRGLTHINAWFLTPKAQGKPSRRGDEEGRTPCRDSRLCLPQLISNKTLFSENNRGSVLSGRTPLPATTA